jgi:galactokinase/mevalonate kinase-like predicted kinase
MLGRRAVGATVSVSVFAPARVDLSAGFPDVEPFCSAMPAQILNVAIHRGVSVDVSDSASAAGGDPFAARLAAQIATRLGVPPVPVRITHELPLGSGLGCSGAVSVAVACLIGLLAGDPLARADIVALAVDAERASGVTGGTQDQLASVFGGAGLVERYRDVGYRSHVQADLAALGARMTLVHAGGTRHSGSIIDAVLRDTPLDTATAIVADMNMVGRASANALARADWVELAECMNASATLLLRLHPAIVETRVGADLRDIGARAAKPCGAGGPGAVWVALNDPQDRAVFRTKARERGFQLLSAQPTSSGLRYSR